MKNNELRIREIPYNYTSFTDKEIVIKYLGEEVWKTINDLRKTRKTGVSARMLFEILGDMWIVDRNPFVQDDLLKNKKRLKSIFKALHHRLDQVQERSKEQPKVEFLIQKTRDSIKNFEKQFPEYKDYRKKIKRSFSRITRKDNIDFSGLARVTHVTDATDWRIEYPLAVIYPDKESEIPDIVRLCQKMDITIIVRGGGTCYTGSGIPLYKNTIVINIEKLRKIRNIKVIDKKTASIEVQAGVITKDLINYAQENGYIFAVDPTSQSASTIGGNIAMNAGGKKAVMWGTALDNLISWKMIDALGRWVEIERINYKPQKIHETEIVEYKIKRYNNSRRGKRELEEENIRVAGEKFRKKGLGKDVTNKTLFNIPGVQKEGCDGVITSAVFALHKEPKYYRTICLEFFGADLKKAVPAIVEIKNKVGQARDVSLIGLEHLDERYLKAVNYTTKTTRRESPKMMILADIASDNEKALKIQADEIVKISEKRDGEAFIAVSPEARQSFWNERSNTAAIAAHTNAFKVNEDVVIPLERLNEYNTGIERINIELSIKNKLQMIEGVLKYLKSGLSKNDYFLNTEVSLENEKIFEAKNKEAIKHVTNIEANWRNILNKMEDQCQKNKSIFDKEEIKKIDLKQTLFSVLQSRELRISYREKIEKPLKEIFSGNHATSIRKSIDKIHESIRTGRLFVAMHMHAGDGNVHTNIPVNSNDYEMLNNAKAIVDKVIGLALSLGGVISGEHGIGITKFQYLDNEKKDSFEEYKKRVDPQGVFNRGKLLKSHNPDLRYAYTPSLKLLELEALILEASELGNINEMVKKCLRCGKCKPNCTTHVPEANLLYSPRNKILSLGSLIEAFLYEEQTRRGISVNHFDELNDVSDHCTLCHKCFSPCPVDIDFGDVTMKLRNILKANKYVKSGLVHKITLKFLEKKNPRLIRWARRLILKPGFFIQRYGYIFAKKIMRNDLEKKIPEPSCSLTLKKQLENTFKMPLPRLKRTDLRTLLKINDYRYVPVIGNEKQKNNGFESVFYFPGCGCERLYTDVSLASIAMLYHTGVNVVIPPEYMCCGYPMKSSGDITTAEKITIENRVLFHRVATTLNYLDIKTVVVSCGTCLEKLVDYQFDKIFPGSKLMDIHEFLESKNINIKSDYKYIYHEPCHSPIKIRKPKNLLEKMLKNDIVISERCCGEAGTMAVSRPDISTQLRYKKLNEINSNIKKIAETEKRKNKKKMKLVTSCPACIQGLSRYRDNTYLKPSFIVEELAENILGKKWQKKFIKELKKIRIEKVLL
ncbi:MAG: DUF3683 domain-containing protein [Spirochaetia bacterium]|nr:DUF3683 domain-containing protein [Spirochaetia bacterium]